MVKRKKSYIKKINQLDTLSVHAGVKTDPLTGAVMTPIYATSTLMLMIDLGSIKDMNIQEAKILREKF